MKKNHKERTKLKPSVASFTITDSFVYMPVWVFSCLKGVGDAVLRDRLLVLAPPEFKYWMLMLTLLWNGIIKQIPLREREAHGCWLQRWQECKTGVGSMLAIWGIKMVEIPQKLKESRRNTDCLESWYLYTCKKKEYQNREAAQWCRGLPVCHLHVLSFACAGSQVLPTVRLSPKCRHTDMYVCGPATRLEVRHCSVRGRVHIDHLHVHVKANESIQPRQNPRRCMPTDAGIKSRTLLPRGWLSVNAPPCSSSDI